MISVVTISPLLDKIRSICKEIGQQNILPDKVTEPFKNLDQYIKGLEKVRSEIIKLKVIEEDYSRLEKLLQISENKVRAKIGTEQQMKLYTDSLKSHIDQLSLEKLELLENTKVTIKQMKKVNQELYIKMDSLKASNGKRQRVNSALSGHKQSSYRKSETERKAEFSSNLSIRQIVKTQHIERLDKNYDSSNKVKKNKHFSGSLKVHEDQEGIFNIKQNSKTFQVTEAKTDREHLGSSHKRQPNINSYPWKKQQLLKKGMQLEKGKKGKTRLKVAGGPLWRDKVANRSVASIGSMQAATSQKETR